MFLAAVGRSVGREPASPGTLHQVTPDKLRDFWSGFSLISQTEIYSRNNIIKLNIRLLLTMPSLQPSDQLADSYYLPAQCISLGNGMASSIRCLSRSEIFLILEMNV